MSILNYFKSRFPDFSFFLFLLPYLLLIYQTIKYSYLFSIWQFGCIVLIIVFIDLLIGFNNKKKYPTFMGCILLTGVLIFFYGSYLIIPIQKLITLQFQYYIKGKILFVASSAIIFLLLFWNTQKKIINFLHLNVFLLIFSLSIITNFILFPSKEVKILTTIQGISKVFWETDIEAENKINVKPILLIITDAYASPKEIEKKFGLIDANNFYSDLEKKNWQLKYKFYSEEVNTQRSMTSMFNYNLSDPATNFSSLSSVDVARYLINPALISNLKTQKIEFVNNSFFEISKKKPFLTIGDVPNSFTELFLYNSIYFLVKASTAGVTNLEDFTSGHSSVHQYNQKVIDKLTNGLKSQDLNKRLEYYHLLMPHTPYNFGKEFTSTDLKVNTYYQYWTFTNNKLHEILNNVQTDKYRIIITGDHGHGGEKGNITFDIHNTFAAFYGFEKADVDRINSVQDVGFLIDKYLIKTNK